MELYTLDSSLRRKDVLDQFESLIWTERFSEWGDFEVEFFYTPQLRRLLPTGTFLALSHSYRVMKVELVEQSFKDDGSEMLKVSGRSIESLMESRSARNTTTPLIDLPKVLKTGTPLAISRNLFRDICRSNDIFPQDNIPFVGIGEVLSPGNIPEYPDFIDVEIGVTNLYQTISEITQAYRLGFRLLRDGDRSKLVFDIYTGFDRTTSQTVLNPVVFSKSLDNLTNTSYISSVTNYKNIAYVYHPFLFHEVRAAGVSSSTSGFARNILPVDASDIEVEPFEYEFTEEEQDVLDRIAKLPGTGQGEGFRKFVQKEWIRKRHYDAIKGFLSTAVPSHILTNEDKQRLSDVFTKYDAAVVAATPILRTKMIQRGKDELAKNRRVTAFDGEVNMSAGYIYDKDYRLGDVVEFQNDEGVTEAMRVVEQIFVSDSDGERAYPTLEIEDQV